MGKYPKPDGWVGSANEDDLVVVRQGTGGRISQHPYLPYSPESTEDRRNDQRDTLGS